MICLYVKNNTVPVYELFIFLRELLKKTLINECYIPFQIYYDPNVTSDVLLEKVSTACHHLSSVSSLRMTFSSNKTTPSLTVRFEAWVAHVSFIYFVLSVRPQVYKTELIICFRSWLTGTSTECNASYSLYDFLSSIFNVSICVETVTQEYIMYDLPILFPYFALDR